jgi:hypothetical protein
VSEALRVAVLAPGAIVVIGTGVVLARSGPPFGAAVLTLHKLVALVGVVYLGTLAYSSWRAGQVTPSDVNLLLAGAALSVAAFASGAVVSAISTPPTWTVWLHRISSWPAIVALVAGVVSVA